MGATFSTWAKWDDTVVRRVVAEQVVATQTGGPSLIQGAQNLTITGGAFTLINQQPASPQDPEYLRKVLDFLSLVNFRTIQQENLGKWTPGTIKWLLESEMFRTWLETQYAILWGTGMPGAGKTILASVMVDHLQKVAKASSDICVAFVYCRYTEPMAVRDILAAVVRQLLERYPHVISAVEPLYAQHNLERTNPTQAELLGVIRDICHRFRMAYFFIDGLDEALFDEQFDLLDTLKSIGANFFITSRPLIRLKDVLPNANFFDIAAHNEDIELLVTQHINRNPELCQVLVSEEARKQAIKKICESSCGMFLQASLMVELVSRCTTLRSIMERLDQFPPELGVLYEETLKRIESQDEERAKLAKHILTWVVFSFGPLTVGDLRYAVASDPKVDWEDEANLVPESLLASVCCGLIVTEFDDTTSTRTVRLVHYTALDALKRLLEQPSTSPHCCLAEICIERLIHCGMTSIGLQHVPEFAWDAAIDEPKRPLLNYAYDSWHLHVGESIRLSSNQSDAQCIPSILRLVELCNAFPVFELESGFAQMYLRHFGERAPDIFTSPIHFLAFYGLSSMLPLIEPFPEKYTLEGRSALILAAHCNDTRMAELLLRMDDINVNTQDKFGHTALMVAAGKGHVEMVNLLLQDSRIDVRKRSKEGDTALHRAISARDLLECHTAIALSLVNAVSVDVNAADDHGLTPLMLAHYHPPELFDALIQHPNINLSQRDNRGYTPLMHACCSGSSAALQQYFQLPDVGATDNSGVTALMLRVQHISVSATVDDCLSDFQALVNAGVDVNARDPEGFTALVYALLERDSRALEALLQVKGVDVDTRDDKGRNPIMIACGRRRWTEHALPSQSHVQKIKWDINARDIDGKTALMHAAYPEYNGLSSETWIDPILSYPEVDVNAKDRYGMTALGYSVTRAVISTAAHLLYSKVEPIDWDLESTSDGHDHFCPQEEEDCKSELVEVSGFPVILRDGGYEYELLAMYTGIPITLDNLPDPRDLPILSVVLDDVEIKQQMESAVEAIEACGLGLPWILRSWIHKDYGVAIRKLLDHPGIDECGFGYLRHAWANTLGTD